MKRRDIRIDFEDGTIGAYFAKQPGVIKVLTVGHDVAKLTFSEIQSLYQMSLLAKQLEASDPPVSNDDAEASGLRLI